MTNLRSRRQRSPQVECLEGRQLLSTEVGPRAITASVTMYGPTRGGASINGTYVGTTTRVVSGRQKISQAAMFKIMFDDPRTPNDGAPVMNFITIQQPQDYSPFPNRFQVTVGLKGKNRTFQNTLKLQGQTFHIDGVITGKVITGHITVTGPNRSLIQTYKITKQ